MSVHLEQRAAAVAGIFDLLAKVVLGVGVLAALLLLGVAVFTVSAGEPLLAVPAVVGVLVSGAAAALGWAGVALASIVAGYIAEKS